MSRYAKTNRRAARAQRRGYIDPAFSHKAGWVFRDHVRRRSGRRAQAGTLEGVCSS